MSNRSVKAVQSALDIAREEALQLSRRIRSLEDELKESRLAEAEANPHPWLGKKVKRSVTHSWRTSQKTQRGVLEVRKLRSYYRFCSASAGELVVVTSSGITAYNFGDGSNWELDE